MKTIEIIDKLFSISLIDHPTRYDEYPAHELTYEESGIEVALLDSPPDLAKLLIQWPSEFEAKDKNYCFAIYIRDNLPVQLKSGFSLPYNSSSEMLLGIIQKWRIAGWRFTP